MPLPLPNLDDHDYAELVEMARSLIPSECPDWTDHNPSDTGIILLELFAWLTDLLLYQVNQVPDASQEVFLQLLKGDKTWKKPANQSWQIATQETMLALRKQYRAVTAQDYEASVMQDWTKPEALSKPENQSEVELVRQLNNLNVKIGRVKAFENLNLTQETQTNDLGVGHISLVVVPQNAQQQSVPLNEELKKAIWQVLDDRRLLGTKHHVVSPEYVEVAISAELYLEPGRVFEQVKTACITQLTRFFHPLTGGETGQGWTFGRSVYISEVYQQLDQVEGVDYVQKVTLNGKKESILLQNHQLVQFEPDQSQFASKEVKSR